MKLLVCLVALILPVGGASAGRYKATLVVTPSAPVVGDSLVFAGCGYQPGVGVEVVFSSPTANGYFSGGAADANGCFDSGSSETLIATSAGAWDAYTYQTTKGSHYQPLADLDFTVSP